MHWGGTCIRRMIGIWRRPIPACSTQGATELMRRASDGMTWAVLFNTNTDEKGDYLLNSFAPAFQSLLDKKTDWPDGREFVNDKWNADPIK